MVRFHPTRRLTRDDVAAVVATIERRIERLLERRGLVDGAESGGTLDKWTEDSPVLKRAAIGFHWVVFLFPSASILTTSTRLGNLSGSTFATLVIFRPALVSDVTSTSIRVSLGRPKCTGIAF